MRQSQTMVDVSEPEDVTTVQLSSLLPHERFYRIHCFSLLPQVNLITRSISGRSMLNESSIISFKLRHCQEWQTKYITVLLWQALKLPTEEMCFGGFFHSVWMEWCKKHLRHSGWQVFAESYLRLWLHAALLLFFFPEPHFSLSYWWYNLSESIRGGLKSNVTEVRHELTPIAKPVLFVLFLLKKLLETFEGVSCSK